MEIDPRFRQAREQSSRRRRNRWLLPSLIWGGGLAALTIISAGLWAGGILRLGPSLPDQAEVDGTEMVQGDAAMTDNAAAYQTAFIDLPGDPMILRFDTSGGADRKRQALRPPEIPAARAGNDILILTDQMITANERLITTIPSSREDFAFFQAQKSAPGVAVAPTPVAPAEQRAETKIVVEGEEASWGDSIEGVSGGDQPDSYSQTRVENNTSLNFLLPEATRAPGYEDVILKLKAGADLAALMREAGWDEAAVTRFTEGAKTALPDLATLGPGHILAMRATLRQGRREPVQLSLYTADSYAGSLALSDAGQVVAAADPWVDQDLFSFAGDDAAEVADIGRKYRLLDAFYSAAIRNGVPSSIVAETIVLMSQAHDMESFASPGDKMVLAYAKDPGTEGAGPGQVLYAAILGEGRKLECHVFKPTGATDYACAAAGGASSAGGGGSVRAGMVTPTTGVLTSRFGPRMHPILKVAKLHKGLDWAAPTGTPIVAAFGGTLSSAGDGGGYGNLVILSHAGGIETRYAHLSAFAPGLGAGQAIKAGDLIGYVGTTGRSTGPHLHFELYEGGTAVDPLTVGGGGGGAVVASNGSAVETLVDQIIRVESGGKADAKNPLSSATGLGQFIESTWLRMMKQYRPDLAGTMGREDLLALRNDPTISRDMITALAREGEAYLQARGHQITAGRLYLCHFLGAEGANMALSAPDDALVGDVMGAGVIKANPFLAGRTIAYVKEWAELKMNHKGGGGGAVPVVATLSPEAAAYQKIIAALIGAPV
jgi:murein DD-endopeptidase MepM/ murein hydrolase activator NlpD